MKGRSFFIRFFYSLAITLGAAIIFLVLLSIPTTSVTFGISFSQSYATSLGLNWREVYTAMLTDLHPPLIRLSAEWDKIEKRPGVYDFSSLDWMMNEAQKQHANVLLVVGQKAPRWPECYIPDWFEDTTPEAKQKFLSYVGRVVTRYREHPALEQWQVENEPFIRFPFGNCEDYHSEWVQEEIERVRLLDPDRPIVLTDSGELGFWWRAARLSDHLGVTVYRIVRTPQGGYWSYAWLPSSWYRVHAWLVGKSRTTFLISELQAEPWFGDAGPGGTSIEEQEKTMNPERLKRVIRYARHTGASVAYLWGVEWWYWMKEKRDDPRYWTIIRDLFLPPV